MPQARGVDWGIVSTLVAADTPGLSVKKVETTGAYKDKEGWAVVRASRKSAVHVGRVKKEAAVIGM